MTLLSWLAGSRCDVADRGADQRASGTLSRRVSNIPSFSVRHKKWAADQGDPEKIVKPPRMMDPLRSRGSNSPRPADRRESASQCRFGNPMSGRTTTRRSAGRLGRRTGCLRRVAERGELAGSPSPSQRRTARTIVISRRRCDAGREWSHSAQRRIDYPELASSKDASPSAAPRVDFFRPPEDTARPCARRT